MSLDSLSNHLLIVFIKVGEQVPVVGVQAKVVLEPDTFIALRQLLPVHCKFDTLNTVHNLLNHPSRAMVPLVRSHDLIIGIRQLCL